MKVKVVKSYHNTKKFTVEVSQCNQCFRLDYTASKAECSWYAKMFRIALKKHDKEMQKWRKYK